jgi:hypothetical protein
VTPGAVNSAGLAPGSVNTATIADGSIESADLAPSLLNSTFWNLGGNTGAGHFLGTTDDEPLVFKVNNAFVLQIFPDAVSPTLIAGHGGNLTGAGSFGSVIAGGGASGFPNLIGKYSTYGTISGGYDNQIAPNAPFAKIGGGAMNAVGIDSGYATIGGGSSNNISENAMYATIPGGHENNISTNSSGGVIGGGVANSIGPDASVATIAGGAGNRTSSPWSSTGGGENNWIATNAWHATISGGGANVIGNYSPNATIAGGGLNSIGPRAPAATIGGGGISRIGAGSGYGTIAGGIENSIGTNSAMSVIGGGDHNVIMDNASYAIIPGGDHNSATNYSFAAGYRAKANHSGSFVWSDHALEDFSSTTNRQFAVRANNGVMIQSANTALDLRGGGAVRVAGAGINTSTPVFTHRATAGNTSGPETRIDHPHCNSKSGAILIVTYNFNPAGLAGTRNDRPVGIYYTGSRWAIYNLDGTAMPVGAAYNVLVANPWGMESSLFQTLPGICWETSYMKNSVSFFGTVLLVLKVGSEVSFAATARSTGFQVDGWTVDGGGGVSSGGGFEVAGTMSQPDPEPHLAAGCWSVDPGFWGEYAVLAEPGAPRLGIRLLGPVTVVVSFTPSCGDWVLQFSLLSEDSDPTAIRWTDDSASGLLPVGDELTRNFHIPSWGQHLFVRLRQR